MVLFVKNAATKAHLLANRAFSTTQSNSFAYLIKNIPKPGPKVPFPHHVKCKQIAVFKKSIVIVSPNNSFFLILKAVNMWKYLTIFAAIPALILVNINVQFFEEHYPKRAAFRPYEYMRKRQKVCRI
jgi:hypothetical protein